MGTTVSSGYGNNTIVSDGAQEALAEELSTEESAHKTKHSKHSEVHKLQRGVVDSAPIETDVNPLETSLKLADRNVHMYTPTSTGNTPSTATLKSTYEHVSSMASADSVPTIVVGRGDASPLPMIAVMVTLSKNLLKFMKVTDDSRLAETSITLATMQNIAKIVKIYVAKIEEATKERISAASTRFAGAMVQSFGSFMQAGSSYIQAASQNMGALDKFHESTGMNNKPLTDLDHTLGENQQLQYNQPGQHDRQLMGAQKSGYDQYARNNISKPIEGLAQRQRDIGRDASRGIYRDEDPKPALDYITNRDQAVSQSGVPLDQTGNFDHQNIDDFSAASEALDTARNARSVEELTHINGKRVGDDLTQTATMDFADGTRADLTYGADGIVTKATAHSGSPGAEGFKEVAAEYHANGQLKKATVRRQDSTVDFVAEFDNNGQMTKLTEYDALGTTAQATYNLPTDSARVPSRIGNIAKTNALKSIQRPQPAARNGINGLRNADGTYEIMAQGQPGSGYDVMWAQPDGRVRAVKYDSTTNQKVTYDLGYIDLTTTQGKSFAQFSHAVSGTAGPTTNLYAYENAGAVLALEKSDPSSLGPWKTFAQEGYKMKSFAAAEYKGFSKYSQEVHQVEGGGQYGSMGKLQGDIQQLSQLKYAQGMLWYARGFALSALAQGASAGINMQADVQTAEAEQKSSEASALIQAQLPIMQGVISIADKLGESGDAATREVLESVMTALRNVGAR